MDLVMALLFQSVGYVTPFYLLVFALTYGVTRVTGVYRGRRLARKVWIFYGYLLSVVFIFLKEIAIQAPGLSYVRASGGLNFLIELLGIACMALLAIRFAHQQHIETSRT